MFLPRFPWPVPARISQAARRAHSAALARPGPSIHDDRLSTTTQAGKPQSRGERLGPGMTREVYVPAPLQPLKRRCDRRATSTGETAWSTYMLRRRLSPEPLRALRPETKGQAAACPDRTGVIPCNVRVSHGGGVGQDKTQVTGRSSCN